MSRVARTMLFAAVVVGLSCSSVGAQSSVSAQTDSSDIPRHLRLARDLVEHVRPDDNRYMLGGEFISFPGDLRWNKYSMHADCSGLVLALFDRAKYQTESHMAFLVATKKRKRPHAEDFVFSIANEKGFTRIRDVRTIKPGDVLAYALLSLEDQRLAGSTGHVRLIDSAARRIEPRKPIVEGTEQFELSIIDSTQEYGGVGPDDSRRADPAKKLNGLGKGTIRIYAGADGELVGWAKTFKNATRFFSYDARFPSDTRASKAAIGRPLTGN